MSNTPVKIEIIPITAADVTHPLPPRLSAQQAVSELKSLNERSCENQAALDLFRHYTEQGYHLICWPDGTRAAIRTANGGRIPPNFAFALYNQLRVRLEQTLDASAGEPGPKARISPASFPN
ncbi:MAG: hypothetical protein EHM62_01625 [Methylococcus sp.]|nr:MAG: hypothetical protein EHM62_01625 [Methylococcus sp.]